MNREPCRIDDDPSYDYSDYCEGKGDYKEKPERDPDELRDEAILNLTDDDDWNHVPSRNIGSLDPLI